MQNKLPPPKKKRNQTVRSAHSAPIQTKPAFGKKVKWMPTMFPHGAKEAPLPPQIARCSAKHITMQKGIGKDNRQ